MGIVRTTIVPPRAARPVVRRRTLTDLTERVGASRITTVCAPAGSGKTTAMTIWADALRTEGRPVLWLAARAGITDMASFMAALEGAAAAEGLVGPERPRVTVVDWLAILANEDARRPVLVVDDAQQLPDEAIDFLERLVAGARDALTTVVASRGASRVPIARLRSLGFLVEVGFPDLCWSAPEAGDFIARAAGTPVDAAALQNIIVDAQGWAAGIVLASDIYARECDARAAVRPTGLRHEFAEYFHEEVFAGLAPELRDFVVDTSVLDDLTPAACAAVTGREEARPLLDRAFADGLFIAPVDREHGRYAYHKLFRAMVVGRLMDRAPSRAAELHRRASRFFAGEGDLLRAIEHARSSGDDAFLADQLDLLAQPLIYAGYLYRIDELAADLSPKLVAERPDLLLALAWRRIRTLAFSSAEKLIATARAAIERRAAEGHYDGYDLDALNNRVRHRLVMLEAARDNMPAVERDAEALLAEVGDDDAYLSCTLLAQLMSARRELYHFHDTLKLEAETRKALGRPGSRFASIALKASVAPTLLAQGKTAFARQFLTEALDLARSIGGAGSGLAALPALPLAELLYECGDLREAATLVEDHLPTVRQWGFVDQIASGFLVRARLAAARGDLSAALAGLEEAHLVAIECGLDRLRAFVVAEQVRVLVKVGHPEEAERAFAAGDPRVGDEPVPTLYPSRRNESVAVAWLRCEMQRHRLVRARKVAKRWLDFVKRSGAIRSAVTFELLLAEIAVLGGNRSEARRAVRAAVEMAEPAGWVRVFVDEGQVIASLLSEAYKDGPALETPADRFAARLASMMNGGPAIESDDGDDDEIGLGGRLASREIDILIMVSGGLRNREIGDRLGLTEGTVKWYMQQIYDKLGVRRRPQAVMRARQLGLLP